MANRNIYRSIVEQVPDGIYILSRGKFDYVNPAFERLTGIRRRDLPARAFDFLELVHPADRDVLKTRRETAKRGKKPATRFRIRVVSGEGTLKYLELNTALVSGREDTVLGIVRDVTEATAKEAARKRQERRFRAVIEAAAEPILIVQDGLIKYANPAVAMMSGFSREALTGRPFRGFIVPEGLAAVEAYDRRRKTGGSAPFFYETIVRSGGGDKLNLQMSVSQVTYRGKQASLAVAQDITKYKKAEARLNETLDKMRAALGATVQAIARIVEHKDPYTAGHQQRVADLARAVAAEMDLSPQNIDAIRMAGQLHDLGKVSIPSEILTKPTKLTAAEFELIMKHPQVAYDILKPIVFPWPVAEIIRQHHERTDGSGYPRGLKGDEILIEAKVLAVADVVEAMITHRPYRPARKLEEALFEISSQRGILYDPAAADACRRMLVEKGFTFRLDVGGDESTQ